jgi:predicted transcriptional regulator
MARCGDGESEKAQSSRKRMHTKQDRHDKTIASTKPSRISYRQGEGKGVKCLQILFHLGTSKAPTAWMLSFLTLGGTQSSGSGLKLSFLARTETSEPRLWRSSVGTNEKVSSEATRFSDMLEREEWELARVKGGEEAVAPGQLCQSPDGGEREKARLASGAGGDCGI